jgi:hypothetical protein
MMGHLRLQKKECGKPGAKLTKTNRGNDGGAEQHHAHGAAAMADSYGDDSGSAVARSSSSVPAQGRGEGRTGSAIRKGKQTAVRQQLTKEVATVGEGGTAAQLGARPALNVTREVAWRRRQPLEREREGVACCTRRLAFKASDRGRWTAWRQGDGSDCRGLAQRNCMRFLTCGPRVRRGR